MDTRAENDKLFRGTDWFESEIKKPLDEAGVNYDIEMSWSSEWQWAIQRSASHFGATTIYLPVHSRANRRRFTFAESKWELLKSSSCPVILVRPNTKVRDQKIILAAVNFQAESQVQKAMNKDIVERAQLAAKSSGAELHIVNAYIDSSLYPDRGKLANITKLPPENIHVELGYTDEVVSDVANRLNAGILIIGTLGQTGKRSTIRRGNTAERVIAAVGCDVMVFNDASL